jgi:hypothetical protein
MRSLVWLSVIPIFLAGCGEAKKAGEERVVYISPSKTTTYEFANGIGRSYLNDPYADAKVAAGEFVEILGSPLHDCSEPAHRCLSTGHMVFAVPTTVAMAQGITYAAAGVQFRVLECQLETREGCKAALILGDCQVLVDTELCRPAESDADREFGGVLTFFIYNTDVGVTAFGTVGRFPDRAEDLPTVGAAAAGQFVLHSPLGLLKAPIRTSAPTRQE